MWETVIDLQQNLIKNYMKEESAETTDKKRKRKTMKHLASTVPEISLRKEYLTQATINTMFKKCAI